MSAATRLCEWCSNEFIPSVNRPEWTKCPSCTFNPSRRKRGAAPDFALPASTAQRTAFIVPGAPVSINRVYRMGFGKNGHRIMFYSEEGKRWKASVAGHALSRRHFDWRTDGRYRVEIVAYFARASADIDNIVKPALDSLQGILFDNDRQVTQVNTTKALDPIAPRLVMTVERVG